MHQIVAKFIQKYKWQIYQTTTTKLKPLNSKQRGIGLNLTKKNLYTTCNYVFHIFECIQSLPQRNYPRRTKTLVKTSQSLSLTSSFNDFLERLSLPLLLTTSVTGFEYHLKSGIISQVIWSVSLRYVVQCMCNCSCEKSHQSVNATGLICIKSKKREK